jgi:hypothetical protein
MSKSTGLINEYLTHIRDYDYEVVCGASATEFPEEYEIPRENTGTLKDQGTTEACVSEVIAQIAESFYKEEMSEGFIYGKFRKESSYSPGMILSVAMDFWRSIGTLPKKYIDILLEMPDMKTFVNRFDDLGEIAQRYKLKGYVAINQGDKSVKDRNIKDALTKYNRGLVAVSHKGFKESHCILLTGWNDKNYTYKFKNSWGTSYGDNGFSEIPKDLINDVYLPIFEDIVLPFEDVSKDDWFYKDVEKMYFTGFMNGTGATTFEPNRPMTRAEMATMCNRILKEIDNRLDIFNRVLNEKARL